MPISPFDCARSLSSLVAREERVRMLNRSHIAPLTEFVRQLREKHDPKLEFPDFDPLDGGIHADILFLFEKPGPGTSSSGKGSGFISRNNDDPTAEATFKFMNDARLPRERTVIWNMIPGWNGTRKITGPERQASLNTLNDLLCNFSKSVTVVLVGRQAQRARQFLEGRRYRVILSDHPSPIVRARYPDRWRAIPSIWATAQ